MNDLPPITDISSPPAEQPQPLKDRRTGLMIFGGLEILLGGLLLLMAAFMVLGQVMLARTGAGPYTNARMILYVVVMYLGLAALFVSLGIGSIQCRRWARALTLILSWPWFASGLMSLPMMAVFLPRIVAASAPQGQQIPPHLLKVILFIQLIIIGIALILIPGALLIFYSRRDVKATCETRDPARRWTDSAPLPVLGVALALCAGALFFPLFGLTYGGVMPFFGRILTGLPGMVFIVAFSALWLWIGLMWYRRKIVGWWMLLAALLVLGISNTVTFPQIDMVDFFRKMGYPESQVDMMRQQIPALRGLMTWGSAIWLVPLLAFLIWTKRFFGRK